VVVNRERRGVLDAPPEPVIGFAEGETWWRGMTVDRVALDPSSVIASEAKQSIAQQHENWIASSLTLLAMTVLS
jgi:hypothetical protein